MYNRAWRTAARSGGVETLYISGLGGWLRWGYLEEGGWGRC